MGGIDVPLKYEIHDEVSTTRPLTAHRKINLQIKFSA